MKISLFKQRKPRGFQFKPRYHNPKKEALKERIAAIEKEVKKEREFVKSAGGEKQDRAKMRRVTSDAVNFRRSQNKKSNLRILLFAGVLLLLFYVYINTDINI